MPVSTHIICANIENSPIDASDRQALQNMKGHARVFDDDFPEFVTLQNSLASLETRVGSLEIDKKKAKTTEKDVSERLTRLEDLVTKHSSNLRHFYEHLRVIEDAALEVSCKS